MPERHPIILACTAPYAGGGLGQHFSYFVDTARAEGGLARYFTPRPKPGDAAGTSIDDHLAPLLIRCSPVRFFPGAINHLINQRFDRAVARRLPGPPGAGGVFIGFAGQSLHCFERARALGYERLELIAGNSHVRNVERQHALARSAHPLERSWLNAAQVRKTLREYELADIIHVASEYTLGTFLAQGMEGAKMHRVRYPVDPRFVPSTRRGDDGLFRIVYTGSLSVAKGVPLLIEAFARFVDPQARLTLVGGSGTRGMHRYLRQALATDPRIRIAPGDPLPHLQQADVYVHPSYEDNLAYAGLEALACGLMTVVTEDTGMKEYVHEGVNGYIIPTGSVDAILESLQAVRRSRVCASA